jgi:hypothetical protein
MRKIEDQMVAAVQARKNWESGNTRVEKAGAFMDVYLHGNHIARVGWQAVPNLHTFREWQTRTTASRLCALGIKASIRQGRAFIDGQMI